MDLNVNVTLSLSPQFEQLLRCLIAGGGDSPATPAATDGASAKRGPGRPKKDAEAPAPAPTVPAAAPTAAPVATPAAPVGPTLSELGAIVTAAVQAMGIEPIREMMEKQFKISVLKDLKPEQYAEFAKAVAAVRALTGQ